MANHKSAKKRSLQSIVKNSNNIQYLSKIRTALNNFETSINSKNPKTTSDSYPSLAASPQPAAVKIKVMCKGPKFLILFRTRPALDDQA